MEFKEIDKLVDDLSLKIKKNNNFKAIALIGDLGTGKTYISKRICKNLGILENVKSPTFTYFIEYKSDNFNIFHFDLYRLSSIDELYEIGYEENIGLNNTIYLIEWANNILEAMPDNTLYIELKYSGEFSREILLYEIKEGVKINVDLNNYNFN